MFAAATVEALEDRRLMAFGLTTSSSSFTVNTGAQLVFSIARTAGSGSVGDLTSMQYSGTELEAPFSATSRYSHYESGLSSTTTVSATVDPNNQWILITCNDTSGVGVIEYFLARKGYNNIYIAFYSAGPNSPSPGEMRFITYTNHSILTNAPAPSNNTGNTGAIESSDVFGHADGTTSSKYYGEYRAVDTQTYGLNGGGFGVYMNIGNRETSSGGPFYKDIDYQTTSSQSTELYNYTFSGHSQTENFRPGLKGPFALEFTTGATPAAPDYSFIDTLGVGSYITGYVGASGRGTLTGTASGVPGTLQETVALSNAADQYWTLPNTSTGAYTITEILPGTYTETIYQGELAVGTQTVTINAGQTTACNITDTLYTPSPASTIFTIGTWDGTPLGFLNSNLITDMHPTDVRMSPWATDATGVTNFIVGTTPVSDWPMAEWHQETTSAPYVDTDNRITFTLTAAQAATAQTLRIGLTRLYSGRPNITVNSSWTSTIQGLTTQPTARGLTTGNWRGNNCIYSYNIPTTALVTGTNTIDIYDVSGSTGTLYSGYHIYDAVDLVNTSSITNTPVVTTLVITPANKTVPVNAQQTYTATAYDQFGNPIAANIAWATTLGTIDNTGAYVAPAAAGSGTITAIVGTVTATTNITAVVGTPPTVATPAAASPSPVSGTTTNLSVLGADSAGESTLTYAWSASGPASVQFSANGTNAAKSSVATFSSAGMYTFTVTITDGLNLTTTSSVAVTVNQTATSVTISPTPLTLGSGATQQFSAVVVDQFANAISSPSLSWSATNGMVNSRSGLFTAGSTAGSYSVTATSGSASATVSASVVPTNYPASAGDGFYLELASDHLTEQIWVGTPGRVGPANGTPTYSVLLANLPSLTFGPGSSANGALTINASNGSAIPAGGIVYDGGTGSDTLNLIVAQGNNAVVVGSNAITFGSGTIGYANLESIAVTLGVANNLLTQTAQPGNGATLSLTDPTASHSLTVNGGTFTIPAPPAGSGIVAFRLASLTIGSRAKLVVNNAVSHADRYLLMLGSLSVALSNGTLDLGDSDLDLQNGSASVLGNVGSLIAEGYNLGSWTAAGITSSSAAADTSHQRALGVIENNQSGSALFTSANKFDGTVPGQADILIKYTYYGDANLDGKVDGSDYSRIDNSALSQATGWLNGDFNYDAILNGSDYTLIDNAFNTQSASLAAQIAARPGATFAAPMNEIISSDYPPATAIQSMLISAVFIPPPATDLLAMTSFSTVRISTPIAELPARSEIWFVPRRLRIERVVDPAVVCSIQFANQIPVAP